MFSCSRMTMAMRMQWEPDRTQNVWIVATATRMKKQLSQSFLGSRGLSCQAPKPKEGIYANVLFIYIYKKINDRAEVDSAYNKKLRKYWRRFHHVSISLICNKKTTKWQGACTKTQLSKAYAEHTLKHMHYVDPTDLFLCFILKHRNKYCLPQITFTHLIRSWILQS